jgi:pilus assembly protein Flp/PilA
MVGRGTPAFDDAILASRVSLLISPIALDLPAIFDLTFCSRKGFSMLQLMKRFRQEEEGAALVEYGLLLGLIAVICIVAVTLVGSGVSNAFSSIAVALPAT